MTRARTWTQRAGVAMIVLSLVLGLTALRAVVESHRELTAASELQNAGDRLGAIEGYRRALRWYAPGNPYSYEAARALLEIGRESEAAGEDGVALRAYRSLVLGIRSLRGTYTPYRSLYAAAESRLRTLETGIRTGEEGASVHHSTPKPWAALLGLAGYILWLCGLFGFTQRAWDLQGRWIASRWKKWGAASGLGLVLFVVGLLLA